MKCGKIGYQSKDQARHDLVSWRQNKRYADAKQMRPYQCEKCGLWHLTSQSNRHQKHRLKVILSLRRKRLKAEQSQ